jgi:cobalt/nickel transport system permease protein
MENKIPPYLLLSADNHKEFAQVRMVKPGFLDKTILHSASTIKSIYIQAENAGRDKFLQSINPHVKLISLIYIAVIISFVSNLYAQLISSSFIFILFVFSGLSIVQVYRKIFFIVFLFGFLLAAPASLNIISPGEIFLNLVSFAKPSHLWIYTIPQDIGITFNGLKVVSLICLRVLNTVSFSLLIIYTTSFPEFIKTFKFVGVPDTFLMIISLAYKYIFILSRTIEDVYFALKSRLSGSINNKKIRNVVSGRVFYIFKRSMIIYENTYFAMVSRAYHGTIVLHSKRHFVFKDFLALLIIISFGIFLILI